MRTKMTKTRDTNKKDDRNRQKPKKSIPVFYQVLIAFVVLIACFWIYMLLILWPIEEEEYQEAEITFSLEVISDDTMELRESKTERKGKPGKEKNIWKVKKKGLLAKKEISRKYDRTERLEEPVNEVERRGTRKWQYMICSDGSYRYYDDEQFANPNTGFTHASEDFCAKNGQGTMVSLADRPPANNSRHTYSYDELVAIYGDPYAPTDYSWLYSHSSTPSPDLTTLQPDYSSETNNETGTDRTTANNICQSKANSTYQSLLRQLGAMGAGGGSERYQAEQARDNTYRSCMGSYGF